MSTNGSEGNESGTSGRTPAAALLLGVGLIAACSSGDGKLPWGGEKGPSGDQAMEEMAGGWGSPDASADLPYWFPGEEGSSYGDMVAESVGVHDDAGWYWGADASAGDSGSWVPPGGDDPPPEGCVPNCEQKQCGPDGCGGSCGWCSASASCQGGTCVVVDGCTPECAGLMVGEPDGCGGVCTGGGMGIGLKPGGAQDVGYFRKLVDDGQVPTEDLFPVEGFLNEHDTPLPAPDYSMLVTLHAFLGLFYDPQEGKPLISMQLGMNSGLDPTVIANKHFNLAVVVDASGSMGEADKMEFVKIGLKLMVETLDEQDIISIVSYDDVAAVAMAPVHASDENKPKILAVIDGLTPGGSTNLYGGMVQGFEQAMKNITDSEAIHRVLLLSDGNITAGVSDLDTILNKAASYKGAGIGITTLGVGLDFNFELMYKLASQGNGNFYFLDKGEKLVEVFQSELEYLLTPVADNLKISFFLPPGFHVEDIFGFDFDEQNGEVVILGPSPQYTVAPEDDKPPVVNPGDDGKVTVSTLFASKKNGLVMVKIAAENPNIFDAWEAVNDFAVIKYSYELADKGKTESATKKVAMGSLSYFAEDDPGSPLAYFTGPTMQRNFCILRMGLAMKQACTLFHQEPADIDGAVKELADADTFCKGINLTMQDPVIDEDLELMDKLKTNMCTILECVLPQ